LDIVLATINARYAHSALALRWLRANLGELSERSTIVEFVLGARCETMAERLLALHPRIVALSVYIWNVEETTRLVAMLRQLDPSLRIVLGGPEVSHETAGQPIVNLADHVITGPGELAFARLCRQLLFGPRPLQKVIAGEAAPLESLHPPYELYDDEDIAHRNLYVEASRGCPFKCEFCLSSLDRTAQAFETAPFLSQLSRLYERGARRFKFIDRTFNLKTSVSTAILQFLLERMESAQKPEIFAHFELVPDHLPQALCAQLARFPAGSLQLEIGIQTWNPEVQALISRRQDNERAEHNLRWLRNHTQAHLHVDLIAGLPGEDLESFGAGFDRLVALGPHEIQVGVLKRLRGAPIARHTQAFDLRFDPSAPYNVLSTDRIPFGQMQRIARFARYWDLVANSGRFPALLALLLGPGAPEQGDSDKGAPLPGGRSPGAFAHFMAFCDWLWSRTDATWRFSPHRLSALICVWLQEMDGTDPGRIEQAAASDDALAQARTPVAGRRQARFIAAPDSSGAAQPV
jgi:hypothetical protein